MSDTLPPGWIHTNLESIAFINMGQSPKSIYYNSDGKGLPFFQGKAEFGHLYPTPKKWCTKPNKIAEQNDILLSVRAPVGPTNLCLEQSCIGRGLAAIRGYNGIDQNFLYYYFKNIEEWLQAQGTGSTFQAINGGFIKQLSVNVPPANEQKRIAEKLEQLLTAVDATKIRLDKVPTILKRFRQSVLAAAVSGELTKDWRTERGFNETVTKSKIEKKLLPRFFDLPQEWKWEFLGNLIQGIESGKNIKCDERSPGPDEFGIVKISAVTWGFFNENESKTLNDKELFLHNRRIQVGDLLISRANTLELLGAPVIVDKITKNLMLSDKVLRLLSVEGYKEWLNICLRSPLGRYQIELLATGNQLSMRNIAQKNLKRVHIPTPSKEEIIEIVGRVDVLLKLANELESKLSFSTQKVKRLTSSILSKAFRGELVPQNPSDEPAELLLEKIAKAKQEQKSSKPAKRRKKTMPSKAKKGSLHSIVEILKSSEKPISAQQLLAVYTPSSPGSEEVEEFFVALRDCLTKKEILRERRGEEDWFSLVNGVSVS